VSTYASGRNRIAHVLAIRVTIAKSMAESGRVDVVW
jgi:hypothetical protein